MSITTSQIPKSEVELIYNMGFDLQIAEICKILSNFANN